MTKALEAKKKDTSLVTWGALTAVIVVLVIYIIAQVVAAFLVSVYPAFKHWSSDQANQWLSNSVGAQFWVTLIIEALSLYLLYLFLKRRHSNFKGVGLVGRPRWVDAGYALIGFGVYFAIYSVALIIIQRLVPHFNFSQKQDIGFSSSTSGLSLWLVFVSLVVLPPIVEEILFRGFLYSGLRTKFPKLSAAVITSLLFASLHLLEGISGILWIAGVDTFILSMVLVYLRERTGSLYASMGLHMLKNFLAFATLFLFHFS